jgi:hypothetical protein
LERLRQVVGGSIDNLQVQDEAYSLRPYMQPWSMCVLCVVESMNGKKKSTLDMVDMGASWHSPGTAFEQ